MSGHSFQLGPEEEHFEKIEGMLKKAADMVKEQASMEQQVWLFGILEGLKDDKVEDCRVHIRQDYEHFATVVFVDGLAFARWQMRIDIQCDEAFAGPGNMDSIQ